MYSHYLYDDRDAFQDLYVDVSNDSTLKEPEVAPVEAETQPASAATPPKEVTEAPVGAFSKGLSMKSLLSRFRLTDGGLIPLLILAFLLFDSDDDERLITIALAFLLGL